MSRVVYAWIGQDYRGNILIGREENGGRTLWRRNIPLAEMDSRVLETVSRQAGTQVHYQCPGSDLLARALVVLERGDGPADSTARQQ